MTYKEQVHEQMRGMRVGELRRILLPKASDGYIKEVIVRNGRYFYMYKAYTIDKGVYAFKVFDSPTGNQASLERKDTHVEVSIRSPTTQNIEVLTYTRCAINEPNIVAPIVVDDWVNGPVLSDDTLADLDWWFGDGDMGFREEVHEQMRGMRVGELRPIKHKRNGENLRSHITSYGKGVTEYSSHLINGKIYAFRKMQEGNDIQTRLYNTGECLIIEEENTVTGEFKKRRARIPKPPPPERRFVVRLQKTLR